MARADPADARRKFRFDWKQRNQSGEIVSSEIALSACENHRPEADTDDGIDLEKQLAIPIEPGTGSSAGPNHSFGQDDACNQLSRVTGTVSQTRRVNEEKRVSAPKMNS